MPALLHFHAHLAGRSPQRTILRTLLSKLYIFKIFKRHYPGWQHKSIARKGMWGEWLPGKTRAAA
jgi:hypothetical protein